MIVNNKNLNLNKNLKKIYFEYLLLQYYLVIKSSLKKKNPF